MSVVLTQPPTPGSATAQLLPGTAMALPFIRTQVALTSGTDGRAYLVAVPYSATGKSQVFCIRVPDGAVEKLPLDDDGAHAVVAGPEGRAYLGTITGMLYAVDPGSQTLTPLAARLSERIRCGVCSSTGRLYFGGQQGSLVEVFPGENRAAVIHQAGAPIEAFAALPDGRVLAFLHGACEAALVLAPDAAPEPLALPALPDEEGYITQAAVLGDGTVVVSRSAGARLWQFPEGDLQAMCDFPALPGDDHVYCLQRVDDTIWASGALTGTLYGWTGTQWDACGTPMPHDPLVFAAVADRRIVGVTYHGRFVHNLTSPSMFTLAALPTREPCGMTIQAMGVGPDRKLYFAPQANMRVGCWDPDEDEMSMRFVASPFPGEVSAFGFAGERLLMGCSDACAVMSYYPELPYRFGDNPILLGRLEGLHRPLGPMVHHGNYVYFTAAGEGRGEGAIVRLNPLGNQLIPFAGVIARQDVTSLVADRLNDVLVAGGAVAGAGAQVAIWSPYEERTVATVTPFPDAGFVRVWAAEGGRAYVTDGGERYAVITVATGEIMETGAFPLGAVTSLINTLDGELYGLAGGWMFHWDVVSGTVQPHVAATGALLTEVRRGLYAYTHEGRLFKVQVW